MDKPFAITLDPGSSLANKTGTWRTEQPVYVDLMPPCNHACPAGENIQQWLYRAEEGGAATRPPGGRSCRTTRCPRSWAGSATGPARPPATGRQLDSAVGINSVEGFLGDEAIRQGWTVPVTAPDSGKRVLIVGAGPSGLSAAYHLRLLGHQVTLRDTAPWAGGMMRFGIPAYRLPRDVLEAEVGRILAMGVTWEGGQTGHRYRGGDGRRRVRRRLPRRRRAAGQAGRDPGWRLGEDPRRGHPAARHGRRPAAAARPPRGGLRRRQHRDGRGQDGPAPRGDRRRRRLPADQGPDAGPRDRGGGSRRGRRADDVAVHHRPCRRGLGRRSRR